MDEPSQFFPSNRSCILIWRRDKKSVGKLFIYGRIKTMREIIDKISACGVVSVVVLDDVKDAVPTAKALLAGRRERDGDHVPHGGCSGFDQSGQRKLPGNARRRRHGYHTRPVQTGIGMRREIHCLAGI